MVHGADHTGMIMTCVERKSGFLTTAKMKDGTSVRLNAAKERAFRIIPPKLRQYFPKKTDFRIISYHALAHVTNRLNNRPRKRLNCLTQLEVLTKAGFALQM